MVAGFLLRETAYGPLVGVGFFATTVALVATYAGRIDRRLVAILLVAFVLRFGAAMADDAYGLFPKADQNGYDYEAEAEAEAWKAGERGRIPWSTSVGAYVHTLGAVYFLFGSEMLLARAFSAFQGVLATLLVYGIARSTVGDRAALVASGVFSFVPSFVYLQSEALRDPTVHVLVLTAMLGAITFNDPSTPRQKAVLGVAGAVVGFAAVWFFRPPAALVMLVPLAILALWRGRSPLRISRTAKITVAIGLLAVMAVLGANYASMLANLDSLTNYRDQWATGGSAYLPDRSFDTLLDVLIFVPLGAFYFLFTPFPWHVHNPLAAIALAENLFVLWPLAILAIPQMDKHAKYTPAFALGAFVVTAAVLFGIVEGNVGTALRHRAQFTWVFVVFAAPAIVRLWDIHGHRLPLVSRFTSPERHPVEDPRATTGAQES